jgi:hypothetical protein
VSEVQTDRANYLFVVKEYDNGEPWIMMERRHHGLGIFRRGFLGFELEDGTSLKEAEKLAAALNAHIKSVSYTELEK